MGNTCTCIDDQKDKNELKTVQNKDYIQEKEIIKIQASFRGHQARKQYN